MNIFITGASRGIGLGLTKALLTHSNQKVIATCRSPIKAIELNALAEQYGPDRLIVIPLDTTDSKSHENMLTQLESHNINALDIVILNAGIASDRDPDNPTETCPADDMRNIFNTNVVGTMLTLQSCSKLLQRSATKLLVITSSILGSISTTVQSGFGGYASYRVSKCAVNMLAATYVQEGAASTSGCKALCVHPGWVQTDMGNKGGRQAHITVDESCQNIVRVLHSATLVTNAQQPLISNTVAHSAVPTSKTMKRFEQILGQESCVFVNYDGEILPW